MVSRALTGSGMPTGSSKYFFRCSGVRVACIFEGQPLAGHDEVVKLAGAGVDDADEGGILLQVCDDVGLADAF